MTEASSLISLLYPANPAIGFNNLSCSKHRTKHTYTSVCLFTAQWSVCKIQTVGSGISAVASAMACRRSPLTPTAWPYSNTSTPHNMWLMHTQCGVSNILYNGLVYFCLSDGRSSESQIFIRSSRHNTRQRLGVTCMNLSNQYTHNIAHSNFNTKSHFPSSSFSLCTRWSLWPLFLPGVSLRVVWWTNGRERGHSSAGYTQEINILTSTRLCTYISVDKHF